MPKQNLAVNLGEIQVTESVVLWVSKSSLS